MQIKNRKFWISVGFLLAGTLLGVIPVLLINDSTNAHDPNFLKVDGVNYGPRNEWRMFDRGFIFAFAEYSSLLIIGPIDHLTGQDYIGYDTVRTTDFAPGELTKVGKCHYVIKTRTGIYTTCQ